MKASELIDQLQRLVEECGDLDVWVDTQYHVNETAPATVIEYEDDVEFEEDGLSYNSGPVFMLLAD